jgi:hypothetical protein
MIYQHYADSREAEIALAMTAYAAQSREPPSLDVAVGKTSGVQG